MYVYVYIYIYIYNQLGKPLPFGDGLNSVHLWWFWGWFIVCWSLIYGDEMSSIKDLAVDRRIRSDVIVYTPRPTGCFMVDITIMGIIMVYKPTYNWGGPSCKIGRLFIYIHRILVRLVVPLLWFAQELYNPLASAFLGAQPPRQKSVRELRQKRTLWNNLAHEIWIIF